MGSLFSSPDRDKKPRPPPSEEKEKWEEPPLERTNKRQRTDDIEGTAEAETTQFEEEAAHVEHDWKPVSDAHGDTSSAVVGVTYRCRVCEKDIDLDDLSTEPAAAAGENDELARLLHPESMFPTTGSSAEPTSVALKAVERIKKHCFDEHAGFHDWNISAHLIRELSMKQSFPCDDDLLMLCLLFCAAQRVPHHRETEKAFSLGDEYGDYIAIFESRFAVTRCLVLSPSIFADLCRQHTNAEFVRRIGFEDKKEALLRTLMQLERYRAIILGILRREENDFANYDHQRKIDFLQNSFLVPKYVQWISEFRSIPPPMYFKETSSEDRARAATQTLVLSTITNSQPGLPLRDVYQCSACTATFGYFGVPMSSAQLEALHPELMYSRNQISPALYDAITQHEMLLHPNMPVWNLEDEKRRRRKAAGEWSFKPSDAHYFFCEMLYGVAMVIPHIPGETYDDFRFFVATIKARFVAAELYIQSDASEWPVEFSEWASQNTPSLVSRLREDTLTRLRGYRLILLDILRGIAPLANNYAPQDKVYLLQTCFICPSVVNVVLRDKILPFRKFDSSSA